MIGIKTINVAYKIVLLVKRSILKYNHYSLISCFYSRDSISGEALLGSYLPFPTQSQCHWSSWYGLYFELFFLSLMHRLHTS